jgi:hypothetical protein
MKSGGRRYVNGSRIDHFDFSREITAYRSITWIDFSRYAASKTRKVFQLAAMTSYFCDQTLRSQEDSVCPP